MDDGHHHWSWSAGCNVNDQVNIYSASLPSDISCIPDFSYTHPSHHSHPAVEEGCEPLFSPGWLWWLLPCIQVALLPTLLLFSRNISAPVKLSALITPKQWDGHVSWHLFTEADIIMSRIFLTSCLRLSNVLTLYLQLSFYCWSLAFIILWASCSGGHQDLLVSFQDERRRESFYNFSKTIRKNLWYFQY